jgi:hypothetical protein
MIEIKINYKIQLHITWNKLLLSICIYIDGKHIFIIDNLIYKGN